VTIERPADELRGAKAILCRPADTDERAERGTPDGIPWRGELRAEQAERCEREGGRARPPSGPGKLMSSAVHAVKCVVLRGRATGGFRDACLTRELAFVAFLSLATVAAGGRAAAGQGVSRPAAITVDVGSPAEGYVRYRQTLGEIPAGQWSIRPWGPREVGRLLAVDSGRSLDVKRPPHPLGIDALQLAPLSLDISYNSSFAFGINDGPLWRGRGLTAAAQGGVVLRAGVLTAALRPVAFWVQNQPFGMMETGYGGAGRYADPLNPTLVDRPQRFGDGAFARLLGGESTVRIDVAGMAAGVSTANQWWGPMSDWPYLLGNNAEGMPRIFAGTSAPVSIGIGRAAFQVFYADLAQSAYTDIEAPDDRRFASGIIASFSPRGLEGFELGAARFFHQSWPTEGLSSGHFRKPLEDFLKRNVTGDPGSADRTSADNQLASLFARWVFPRSGLEIYGEFGREDHSFDERDVILSPDHQSTLGMGIRRAWRTAAGNLVGLRAEFIDLDPSNLARNRYQGGKYLHDGTRQGHTLRGQLLGSGFSSDNGAGTTVAWERFSLEGERDLLSLTRMVVRESKPNMAPVLDVQFVLTGERTRRHADHRVTYGLSAVYELNRNFGGDAGNVLATMRLVW
jgi:hypothetical protein